MREKKIILRANSWQIQKKAASPEWNRHLKYLNTNSLPTHEDLFRYSSKSDFLISTQCLFTPETKDSIPALRCPQKANFVS